MLRSKVGMGLWCAMIVCSTAVCQDYPVPAGTPQLLPREDVTESLAEDGTLIYSVHIKYPLLQYPKSDDPDQENVNQVNAGVFNQEMIPGGLVTSFIREMHLGKDAKAPSYLTGTYSAALLNSGFVSVVSTYVYNRPGKESEYHWFTVNYCHRQQKIYHLFELFRPKFPDPLSRLSALAVSSLKQQGYADPLAIWRQSDRPSILDLRYYTLTDTDLVLLFPAKGTTVQVLIPLDTLKPLLRSPLCQP